MNYRNLMPWMALLTLSIGSDCAIAQSTQEATDLLRRGKAKEAFLLLQAQEAQYAGNVEFDYLLGRVALDAGEPSRATLIFERVLALSPNHAGARLDMGRAYFALGDFTRAKAEFESLQQLNPPPAAQHTIKQYLAAIEDRATAGKTKFKTYGEFAIGHDSNVNAGPSASSVYFPLFGLNFSIGQGARARSDSYHQFNAGGEITHSLSDRSSLFVAADLRFRNYGTIDPYDQLGGDIRSGWIHTDDKNVYRAFVSYGQLKLGDEGYRNVTSFGGDWRHNLSPQQQVSVFAQTSRLRYQPDGMDAFDYDQYLAGASWMEQLNVLGGLVVTASGFGGTEREAKERTDGNKLILGARAGFVLPVRSDIDLYGGATFQYGRYDRENLLYLERRRDKQFDLMLGGNWKFAPGWSLRPQVAFTRNESNTSINRYDRIEGSLTVRKDF